ncbi:hypothetical protein EN35_01190 [Rhodococcus qingshengii]|nr:hypothetical protein EN35_01190 [Rhodococcus qingshengii]
MRPANQASGVARSHDPDFAASKASWVRSRASASNPLQSSCGPLVSSRTRSIGDAESVGVGPSSSADPSIDRQILSTESDADTGTEIRINIHLGKPHEVN